jgi:hypothetical protein
MQMDAAFTSLFKMQVNRTKLYHNINQEAAPMLVSFLEHSLLKHGL